MKRTIIYVFTPKRLREDYLNGKQFTEEQTSWLKIGKTSSQDEIDDKWDVAWNRINSEVRTGISETCVLVDVFEYPELSGNPDDVIRKLMTDDIFNLLDSKYHNKSVKQDDYEIKAGREYVYGASRKQVWVAVATFERNLLIDYQNDADKFKKLMTCITKNNEMSIEVIEDTNVSINQNFQIYDVIVKELKNCNISASHPNNKNYGCIKSGKKEISSYYFTFSRRYNQAIIEIVSDVNHVDKIEEFIVNNNIRDNIHLTEPLQGRKNMDKYSWKLIKGYQDYDEDSIRNWLVENLKKIYDIFEK